MLILLCIALKFSAHDFPGFLRRRLFRLNSACFNAKGQMQGFITSGHWCFAWIRILLAFSVSCLMAASDIPFWKCTLTLQYLIFWLLFDTSLLKPSYAKIPLSVWNFFTLMPKVAAIRSNAALASMDLMRVWLDCRWVYIDKVAWSTKTVASQKRLEVKKPDICGMIPVMLAVNASKDVLSPAAVSDSLLITCFSLLLPSRVSCVHIRTCTTHKMMVGSMKAWNRKCPLMP